MAGDFNKPVVSSTYTNFPTEVRANDTANAVMDYEADGDLNVPEGAIQYNRTDDVFEELLSSVWTPKKIKSAGIHADAASRSCLVFTGTRQVIDGTYGALTVNHTGTSIDKINIPKSFKCTHISINLEDTITAGTLTATLYKNGSTTSKSINITSGKSTNGSITAESFSAGDGIGVSISATSVTLTGGAVDVLVTLWGHFTE